MHLHLMYAHVAFTPPHTTDPGSDGRWSTRQWGTLPVLCAALFLDALDVSMAGVALPSVADDLDLSTSSLQWIVSGYILGYGRLLLLGGRVADPLGRRRVFLVALAVFAAASLLAGSSTPWSPACSTPPSRWAAPSSSRS